MSAGTAEISAPRSLGALATLRAEPAYARMLLGGFISGGGDWFNTVALLRLLRLTGSSLAVGASLAIRSAPRLFLAPLAGTLTGRSPRKLIVVVCDLLSALAALSFLLVTDSARVWIVWPGLTALVCLRAFRAPARTGITPALAPPESLAGANALESMASGSVMLLGAALGGVISGWLDPGPAFLINAVSFALSAILTLSVPIPRTEPTQTRGLVAALREAPEIIRRSPSLRLLLALAALGIGLSTVAAGIGNVSAATILMREAPPDAIGRVYALQDALSSVTFTLSVLASGALLGVMAPRARGALAGAVIAAGGQLAALATR